LKNWTRYSPGLLKSSQNLANSDKSVTDFIITLKNLKEIQKFILSKSKWGHGALSISGHNIKVNI